MNFLDKTKLEILESFGYRIYPAGTGFAATIPTDPDAFYVYTDDGFDDAVNEAYVFLFGEVDPDLHQLPDPASAIEDWTSKPTTCPHCGDKNIEIIGDWTAKSHDDADNEATVTEYQCRSICDGRSFWA